MAPEHPGVEVAGDGLAGAGGDVAECVGNYDEFVVVVGMVEFFDEAAVDASGEEGEVGREPCEQGGVVFGDEGREEGLGPGAAVEGGEAGELGVYDEGVDYGEALVDECEGEAEGYQADSEVFADGAEGEEADNEQD